MGKYVHSPVGAKKIRNQLLEKCVKIIGSKQSGTGSNSSKGVRLIKKNISNCSTRAIKRTIKMYKKVSNHDYELYGLNVYFFHEDLCAEIVKFILDYTNNCFSEEDYVEVFGFVPDKNTQLKLMYENRLSQLRWVKNTNYKEQSQQAEKIENDFIELNNNL